MANKKELKNRLAVFGLGRKAMLPLAAAVILLASSCDNQTGPDTKKPTPVPTDENCDCAEQEHDAACACGKDNCNCTIRTPVVPDPTCACPADTEHLYDASNQKCCDGTDCACRIYYGEVIGLTFNGKNVKIYKKAGANLTSDQMAQAVEKFQYGFDNNTSAILPDMISEINIYNGSIGYDYYSYDNNMVLDLNFNEILYAGDYLFGVSMGLLPKGGFAMVKPSNNLKLANVNKFPTPRQLVAFNKSQRISRARMLRSGARRLFWSPA